MQHVPPLVLGRYELQPTDCYLCGIAFVMNPQSYGEVTLNSANPSDSPRMDPNLVSHPYDRRVIIEGTRRLMDLLEAPVFKDSTVKIAGYPKSRSDEDIWVCFGEKLSRRKY
jgi:choline dehydrogenase-like flavoprotein